MIRLIDPSTWPTVPWKNGGGTATDIAAALGPDGAPDWRVGTAAIVRDGPFSHYPGVTRVFTIVDGPGVALDFPGEGERAAGRDQPVRFAGAPAPFCRLRQGAPSTAFNLMTRDGVFAGDARIIPGGTGAAAAGDAVVLVALDGDWGLAAGGGQVLVPRGWAAQTEGRVVASAPAGARAALATVWRMLR